MQLTSTRTFLDQAAEPDFPTRAARARLIWSGGRGKCGHGDFLSSSLAKVLMQRYVSNYQSAGFVLKKSMNR